MDDGEVDVGGGTAQQASDAMNGTATLEQTLRAPTRPNVAGGSSETAGAQREATFYTQVEQAPPPPPCPPTDSSSAALDPPRVVPPPPPTPVQVSPPATAPDDTKVASTISLHNLSNTLPAKGMSGNMQVRVVLKTET